MLKKDFYCSIIKKYKNLNLKKKGMSVRMEFFDKLGKKASEAYKFTADKTGKLAKETKLKFKMSELKSQIEDLYVEIGKKVYEKHIREEEICIKKDLEEQCTKIDVLAQEIESLQNETLELKDKKQCPKCYKEVDKDDNYCKNCGEKLEKQEKEDKQEKDVKEVEILEDIENTNVEDDDGIEKSEAEKLENELNENKIDNEDSNNEEKLDNQIDINELQEENQEKTNLEKTVEVESHVDIEADEAENK